MSGPDSRCELCCGWGHIEVKGSSNPKCGYRSGYRCASDHKCNRVGCTVQLGSLYRHILEKCPNCKGNHIAFSSRCGKNHEATKAAQQQSIIRTAGQALTSEAIHKAIWMNRVVIATSSRGGLAADGGSKEEETADVREENVAAEPKEVIMTVTEITTLTTTETLTETEAGALATNDWSDSDKLHKVLWVDHCGTGDGSQTVMAVMIRFSAKDETCLGPGNHNLI